MSIDPTAATERTAPRVELRILSTTDIHGHLLPYDYYTDAPNPAVGLSRIASFVAAYKSTHPETLLFDSGDFLQGTPLIDLAMENGAGRTNPVIKAMNLMGYDAATLGNHEFNFGLEALSHALVQAQFPIVCSNMTKHGLPCCPGLILQHRVRDSNGVPRTLAVGLIGVLPVQITQWDRNFLDGRLTVEPMVQATEREAARLVGLGADLIVVLCHSGLGSHPATAEAENAALSVAACAHVDLVLAGHTHDHVALPAQPDRAPVMMAGCWGSHLGLAHIQLLHSATGWKITETSVDLLEVASEELADWAPLTRAVETAHRETIVRTAQPVGETKVPLHTYFSVVAPSAAMQVIATAQTRELEVHLAGTPWADLPILSAVAPFKAGGFGGPGYYTDIPAGPLSLRDVGNLYLYPNIFCGIVMTGAKIREWLERAASQFRQIGPGDTDATLLDPGFASHGFDILYGATYGVDLSRPPLQGRIVDLACDGVPISDADQFVLATNGYRAGGGGGYPMPARDRVVYESLAQTREIVQHYVAGHAISPGPLQQVFRFQASPGTSLVFETGAGAATYDAEAQAFGLTPLGSAANGFLRYRLLL